MLTLEDISALAPRLGRVDVPCPLCGPQCKQPANKRRKVLRVWRNEKGFAGFYCARCEASGYAWDGKAISPRGEIASEHDHHAPLHVRKPELVERERAYKLDNARNYWRRRQPIEGTPAERYLRERRGYTGPLPGTLGFLPARSGFPAMLVAAFGMPDEPEPGVLAIAESCVIGVHVTHLTNDGRKLGDAAKRMHGESAGWPIVLASPNDLHGLVITEGIEDALSAHAATGLGAWAAGSASRLPALAERVPHYIEAVTIVQDADAAGRKYSSALFERLQNKNIDVRVWGQ